MLLKSLHRTGTGDTNVLQKNKMTNAKRTKFSIVDGDTIRLNRALNDNNFVRLANVNAPEMNTKAGHRAKQELKQMLHRKSITIQTVGKSYGRNVAVVRAKGKNINNAMRGKGY